MTEADQTIFFGEFEHNVDEKNRVCINSSFRAGMPRDEQERGFVLTRGYDGCLALYTVSGFMKMSEQIGDTRFSDEQVRAYIRDLFRKAARVKPDSQGRIVLPQRLKDEAEIQKVCVEIGARDHVELWAKEVHDGYWSDNTDAAEKGGGDMPF